MRQSCNGCRVLRKGCNENCSIKPCLEWIKTTDSQANATVFLAKFYGRAGILNLINAGPQHLRPAIFKSLLYEACGRIVNPVYGSVGLLWSGKWQLCQNAVDAVLKGAPITRIAIEDDAAIEVKDEPPLKSNSQAIKHVNNKEESSNLNNLLRVRTRYRFKKSGSKSMGTSRVWVGLDEDDESSDQLELGVNRSTSHDSSLSHQSEPVVQGEIRDIENSVYGADEKPALEGEEKLGVRLALTLGF